VGDDARREAKPSAQLETQARRPEQQQTALKMSSQDAPVIMVDAVRRQINTQQLPFSSAVESAGTAAELWKDVCFTTLTSIHKCRWLVSATLLNGEKFVDQNACHHMLMLFKLVSHYQPVAPDGQRVASFFHPCPDTRLNSFMWLYVHARFAPQQMWCVSVRSSFKPSLHDCTV